MTGQRSARLAKLEARMDPHRGLFPLGLVASPIPSEGLEAWGVDLLEQCGWIGQPCLVHVQPGDGLEILVSLTKLGNLRGEPERMVLEALDTFHARIVCGGGSAVLVQVFDGAKDVAKWRADLERDMAAAGGPDQWVRGGRHGQ